MNDADVSRVSKIIRSHAGGNEDVFQDTFILVLESNDFSEDNVVLLARKAKQDFVSRYVTRNHKEQHYNEWENYENPLKPHIILQPFSREVAHGICVYCYSQRLVHWGHAHGQDRLYCRTCRRTFYSGRGTKDIPKGYRHSRSCIIFVKDSKNKGLSERSIRRAFAEEYNYTPSTSTIHEWIMCKME